MFQGSVTLRAGKSGGGGAGKDPARRPTDPDFAPGYEVGFADGFPYLLLSEVSLPHAQPGY